MSEHEGCYGCGCLARRLAGSEAAITTLRDENARLRSALVCVLDSWVNGRKVKDGICMEARDQAESALCKN